MKKQGIVSILGLCDSNSGSSFHRIYTPITSLHDKEIEVNGDKCIIKSTIKTTSTAEKQFTEQDLIDFDIIAVNWMMLNNPNTLATLCKKHNTLIYYDLDDSYQLDSQHINRKLYLTKDSRGKAVDMYPYLQSSIISHAANADLVTTSNTDLLKMISSYCSFAGVSPNYLPIGFGEFIGKPEPRDPNSPIVIALMGSISHINDYKSIRNIWNRISSDSEIRTKCKLQIIGYTEGDKQWEEIKNIFSVNNFEVEIIPAVSPDKYMDLLNSVDILLKPLEDTEFNQCKSGISLIEAAIKEIPVISGEVYSKKEDFNAYIMCEKASDWFKVIKTLIKKNSERIYEFEKVGKILSEQNLKVNNFPYRIEKIKAGIEYCLNNEYKMDSDLQVYGICYDDLQYTEYKKILNVNIEKPWRFEYQVMIDKLEEIKSLSEPSYVGFFSHKYPVKTQLSFKITDKVFREHKNSGYDMYNFAHNWWSNGKEFLEFSEKAHPGLTDIVKICISKLGKEYFENPKVVSYSNFHLFTRDRYVDYLENWIIPSITYMENDIWDLVNQDAQYKGGLSSEDLEKYTGMTYYNFVTFVCERLIGQYVMNNNLKLINIG